jgi:VWFA-related protein
MHFQHRPLVRLLLVAGIGSLALAQSAPQPTSPNSRLVLMDVIVSNDRGPVRGLTQGDFVLEDKGKKQTITLFQAVEGKPIATGQALPPTVASNRMNAKGEAQATATAILYDRINAPSAEAQAFVRNQVLRVLAALKDGDHLGFYGLGFKLLKVVDFDEDVAPIARAAKALLQSNTVPDGFSADDKAVFRNLAEVLSPMQSMAPQARVNITYPAFRTIGRHMAGIPGRKNLIWIASYFPLTYGNSVDRRKNDEAEVNAFRNNLTESGISLYTIDPGGAGAAFNTGQSAPVGPEGALIGAQRNQAGDSSVNNTATSMTGNQTMQLLADSTGGRSYRNANDIEPALNEALRLSAATYTIGFVPDEKVLDGRTHEIKITVAKKAETDKAKLSYRKQYLAWSPTMPDPQLIPAMGELLDDALLARGIGLMGVANVNPDPAKPGTQAIDLRIGASDIRFDPKDGNFAAAFDVAIAIEGAKVVSMKTFSPSMGADQLGQVMTTGMDTREIVDAPGNGVFRIVVLDKKTGASGTIRIPFNGPAK